MARGWESKAIEEQMNEAEARRQAPAERERTAFEIEQQKRKDGLLLDRARLLREMQGTRNQRYLTLLERGLAHIEAELAKLRELDSTS